MPYIPGVLNFSWEACALVYSHGMWGHILWFGLDCFIAYKNYKLIASKRNKILYVASIIACFLMLLGIFKLQEGMLYSVFIIDFIMAICFLIFIKSISKNLKTTIALTKLLGDLFAGLAYFKDDKLVAVLSIAVLICNLVYLLLCIRERYIRNNAKGRSKKRKKKSC